ncbi:MAG: hypothetical protein H6742_15675 [Alphaproteobacteria bacterium]|nr:hypothetical protein [Alphaproteobacteria bacterium]
MAILLLPLFITSLAHADEDAPGEEAAAGEQPGEEAAVEEAAVEEAAVEEAAVEELPVEATMDAADRALLDALLALLDDEGADGAEALGMLADPRSLWALRNAVRTRTIDVALPATRALAAFPEAGPDLLYWVRDPTRPDVVRVAAAEGAAKLGLEGGPDAIRAALADRTTSTELADRLYTVLEQGWPTQALARDQLVSRPGTAWMAAGDGVGLGFALAATGHFGQGEGLAALGGLTGAAGGVTLAIVTARSRPEPDGQAAFFATSGIGGIAAGALIGAGAAPGSEDAAWAGGLLGGAAGYGLGLGLRRQHPGSTTDTGVASAVAVGTSVLALSVSDLAGVEDDGQMAAAGAGLGAGLALGHATAWRADRDAHDIGLALLTTGYGAYAGLVMPIDDEHRAGVTGLLASSGGLAAYALGGPVDAQPDVVAGAFGGLLFGGAGGAGVGLLVDPDGGRSVQRAMLVGGTAGPVVGGLLAHRTAGGLDTDDVVLTATTTGWAAWQTAGWGEATDSPESLRGLWFLVPSAVGSATAIASPRLDVDATETLAATSLGLWGAYLGTVTGVLADFGPNRRMQSALIGSDVGLVGGILLMSPLVDAPPVVVGVADAGGMIIGSSAALATALFTDNEDPILVASLVGAAGGATGGALLGRSLHRRSAPGRAPSTAAARWPAGLDVGPAWLPTADGTGVWGARMSLQGW